MPELVDFSGVIITPDSAEFPLASSTHAVRTSRPAAVVRPRTTEDVASALAYASTKGLPVSVRSGGHTAYSSIDAALVIDLGDFDEVEVLSDGIVRVGSGARWGAVADTLALHGLVLSSGDASTVGVGGLTLNGGIGWLVRQVGLTIDSLIAAEVVLASGQVVTASADAEPDLFWALRGGGGNFGVVTRFTFRAVPLGQVAAGSVIFDPADLQAALTGWRDVMRSAPELLNSTFTVKPAFGPAIPSSIVATFCYAADDRAGAEAAVLPLITLPTVTGSDIATKPYPAMLGEEHLPEGLTIVDNNGFVKELSDDLIAALVTMNRAAQNSVMMVRWLDGAFNRVAPDATAIAHRDAEALVVAAVVFPPGAPATGTELIAERWASLAGHVLGMYGNFTMDARPGAADAIYPPAFLERLREVKRSYDPGNVFAYNHNITPA